MSSDISFQLYDTLSRSEKPFPPPEVQKDITLYTCGPTVYDHTHIGHMRKYMMDDILKKTLQLAGYQVRHAMNITDVGHLTGDDDSGDDKLEKGARQKNKTVWEVAQMYEDEFWGVMKELNITRPDIVMKATDHISDMIELIQKLQTKGYVYETDEAIYFDTSKFAAYGRLSGQSLDEKKIAVREDVHQDAAKRHPADFALWFRRVGRFAHHTMHWESSWGDGFPGWHIECSAMSMKAFKSPTIDVHTGGIDHIPVHHENEIAQSEAATGKPFVRWWVHHAFLQIDGQKMSKSKQNFYTLQDIKEKGYDAADVRYLFLQTHYRKPLNFTWDALKAAQNGRNSLYQYIQNLQKEVKNNTGETQDKKHDSKIISALFDDLNTPQALAALWDMMRSDLSPHTKINLATQFDTVFALDLVKDVSFEIPDSIHRLVTLRLEAKKNKNYEYADKLRKEIESLGYIIEDTQNTSTVKKVNISSTK